MFSDRLSVGRTGRSFRRLSIDDDGDVVEATKHQQPAIGEVRSIRFRGALQQSMSICVCVCVCVCVKKQIAGV